MIRKRQLLDDGSVQPTERDMQLVILNELANHFKLCERDWRQDHEMARKPFTFGGYENDT